MSDLYLILHKVRGAPAFDVAERIQLGDEEGWIIPTSGHRAYPVWYSDLFGLIDEGTGCHVLDGYLGHVMKNMPEDLRDHYECSREPSTPTRSLSTLLGRILSKPNLRIRRIDGK